VDPGINRTNIFRAGKLMINVAAFWAICSLLTAAGLAQADLYYQKDFPPEEFQARWQKIFDRIGNSAFAIVQGFPKVNGFIFPRQTNEFYYLCGVETPQSYLVLDGKTRRAILFLPPRDERLEKTEGRILSAADAELARKLTGASEVLSTEALTVAWLQRLLKDMGPVIYTPFAPAEGHAQSRGELIEANQSIASDYWDGRLPRELHFVELLRTRLPLAEVRDLSPILDELRVLKSPRETALIRRASQLAGLALLEAMRSTRPGLYEYQLDAAARYVFLVNGAQLDAYRSITAAGTANIWNMHYYRNNSPLKDGDLVLMDYAPDYRYYVSDVARMWPVNGRFGPVQRELLQFVLEYRNAILTRIRPGVTAEQIMREAKSAMEPVILKTRFSKATYEQAARKLVDSGGGVFSHPVGMAVHDVGNYRQGVLKPGHVFSVDPQMWVPEENLYLRYEDVVVVTETGVENLTGFLPSELDDIEKRAGGDGIVQRFPPTPGAAEKHKLGLKTPPPTRQDNARGTIHGVEIVDPYRVEWDPARVEPPPRRFLACAS
jgi:Xaa-Pro aminopeptidase